MKKITLLLVFIGITMLQSCEVTEVTEVYDSPINIPKTEVFEITASFNANNNYSKIVLFDPLLRSSDSVLMYHLYDVVNGQDVWRLMPQTYYFDNNGALDYNFDFTRNSAKIYLSANFNLNSLEASWTQNQTFRVVIIPDGFAKTIDKNNIESVMKALQVDQQKIKKIDF
jgi:hypothetical protein